MASEDKDQYKADPNSTSINERNAAQMDRDAANNANTINNAADVAIATKNPVAAAIGGAVKAADKLTDGKSTEALGKAMAKGNRMAPGGRSVQNASNKLSESGIGDKIGTAASFAGSKGSGGAEAAEKGADAAQKAKQAQQAQQNARQAQQAAQKAQNAKQAQQAEQNAKQAQQAQQKAENANKNKAASGSDAASSGEKEDGKSKKINRKPNGRRGGDEPEEEDEEFSNDEGSKGLAKLAGFIGQLIMPLIISLLPIILSVFAILLVVGVIMTCINDFTDTFSFKGDEQEEYEYDEDYMEKFYDSVDDDSQASNLVVDDNKRSSAVAHIIVENGGKGEMGDFSSFELASFKRAFAGDDETTKTNLATNVFPKYFPKNSYEDNYSMANDVLTYLADYTELAEDENAYGATNLSSLCVSSSNYCSYDIKGFYIKGKGNVSENLNITNLYVRLMQCGTGNGHNYGGTFGQPLEGEELVPFEKYILGVAYQEIGDGAPEHAFKAQMVAARGYILARHADMGGWRTLKQEGDKWILQAASCTQDQVYCDPDKGCSSDDGQWKMVYSGTTRAKKLRGPMDQNSPLRRWASETAGEVLVNSQGYIAYSGYMQTEQNQMTSLAKQGLNYKQILLQIYNGSSKNLNVSDVKKFSCNAANGSTCMYSGEAKDWLQTDSRWAGVQLGNSGANIGQIGCLATSLAIQVRRSGVDTSSVGGDFNPGTFVKALNKQNAFSGSGSLASWYAVTAVVPNFKYRGTRSVLGNTKQEKLQILSELLNKGYYVVAEVKGNTGQHWVAVESISGDTINMIDPGSNSTNMWSEYGSNNTSTFVYYEAVR